MRQNTPQESAKTRKKWENLLREHWVEPHEKLAWTQKTPEAYAASVISGEHRIPHTPLGHVPETTLKARKWPLPSKALTSFLHHNDEWADDPSIGCWAFAEHQDLEAIHLADHFATSWGEFFLAATDERLAVVAESSLLKDGRKDAKNSKWLSRKTDEQTPDDTEKPPREKNVSSPVKSVYEIPMSDISGFRGIKLGRMLPRRNFIRFVFRDGSYVLLESEYSSLKERDLRQVLQLQR